MTKPRFLTRRIAGLKLMLMAMVSLACSGSPQPEPILPGRVAKAERILIGVPEKDTDVPGGEQFRVEIIRVLRGTGDKGKLAVITNSGDKDRHPRYKAGQQYVFMLTRNPAGKGWINSGDAEISLEQDQVRLFVDGKVKEEVSLNQLEQLIVQSEELSSRRTLAGKWNLIMSREGNDFHGWLIDISKDDQGAYQARLVESAKEIMNSAALTEFTVTDDQARLVLRVDETKFEFRGKLENGRVRGSIVMADGEGVAPARMVATELDALRKFTMPPQTEGFQDYQQLPEADAESFEPLLTFVRKHPDSPLALDAYQRLISLAPLKKYDRAAFEKLGDDYLGTAEKWGPYLKLRAYLQLGTVLSRTNYLPDLALEYFKTGEQIWIDDAPAIWRRMARFETAVRLMMNGQRAEAEALLGELHQQYPFDAQVTWTLAGQADQQKNVDAAIEFYAELVGFPMLESQLVQSFGQSQVPPDQMPGRALPRLWKQKHGNLNGMVDYLDKVYSERLQKIAGPRQPRRGNDQGNRVVLCELFTGSRCPPCVAADATTAALEMAYDKSEVIVLRYHQHSPAPDPLSNHDSLERFGEYPLEGTPGVVVNGKVFEAAGGSLEQVPGHYQRLRQTVEPYLTETTALKLDLSAVAANGKIAVAAKASGLEEFPEDVKLHLVLVEDKVEYRAGNGIRHHEMLVRSLIGGVEGIEPVQGKLEFQGEVDLAKVKSDIFKHLTGVEAQVKSPFDEKPLELKALHLVAFLQDDDSDEVLQAAAIPVTGTVSFTGQPQRAPVGRTARSKAPTGLK